MVFDTGYKLNDSNEDENNDIVKYFFTKMKKKAKANDSYKSKVKSL